MRHLRDRAVRLRYYTLHNKPHSSSSRASFGQTVMNRACVCMSVSLCVTRNPMLLMCCICRLSSPKIRIDTMGGHMLGDQIRSMAVQPNSPSTDICFSSKKVTALWGPCLTDNLWSLSMRVYGSGVGTNFFPQSTSSEPVRTQNKYRFISFISLLF